MDFETLIKNNPELKDDQPRFANGLLLCSNCDTPASATLSAELGWIACAPCALGEADSFDEGDLVLAPKEYGKK